MERVIDAKPVLCAYILTQWTNVKSEYRLKILLLLKCDIS